MPVFSPRLSNDQKAPFRQSDSYLRMLRGLQIETSEFYERHMPLQTLKEELDALKPPTPKAVIQLSENCLDLDSLKDLIDYEMKRYESFPLYSSPHMALDTGAMSGWTLLNHPYALIMLIVLNPVEFRAQKRAGKIKRILHFSAGDTSTKILQSGGLSCSRWHAPQITDDTDLNEGLRCHYISTDRYVSGDIIFSRGGTETTIYEDVEEITIAVQTFCRINRTNVMAEYDNQTYRLKALTAANQQSSRLQMLSTVLRLFDRSDGVPELLTLVRHPDHFVRWQVARELIALDSAQAEPSLRRLAESDANSRVRHSAARTLQLFYQKEAS